jgi:hypothetical protein
MKFDAVGFTETSRTTCILIRIDVANGIHNLNDAEIQLMKFLNKMAYH